MIHIYDQPQFNNSFFTFPNLYSEMVNKFPSNSKFVEIGCWKGKSSAYMAVEIINSCKKIEFICVDTWEGSIEHKNGNYPELKNLYEIFKENMKPLENFYINMRMTSMEAVKLFEDNSLDFVFIDASHEYEDVKNDIISWLPKVKKGGVLSGHDYWEDPTTIPDVRRAVNDVLTNFYTTNEGCWVYNV